jgi:glycosyltransferase involved in cell wall biosynthesis
MTTRPSPTDAEGSSAEHPFVSIVLPCRNEEACIAECLDSIQASTYPRDRFEVLVADGVSDDATREIVSRYAAADPRIRLLDNPRRTAPAGLNVAIREARGEVIVRMDGHAIYPPEYLSRLIAAQEETGAENVGTVIATVAACKTTWGKAIAMGLSHPLGVGNSQFRIGATERKWVDHVPFGCWRRSLLDRLGPFDEELTRAQDVEMNARILAMGGRILLLPDVSARYYARRTLRQVGRMLYQYGYFKPLVARKIGRVLTLRQLAPPAFMVLLVLALLWALTPAGNGLPALAILTAYSAVLLWGALGAVIRHGIGGGLALLVVLPVMHVGYGIGYLRGLLDHFLLPRRSAETAAAVALSR